MGPMHGGGLNREPNVVPMIDILLVLLIAAILGLLPKWKVEVQLPVPVAEPSAPADAPRIVLSVAPGPTYSVNSQPIPRDELIPRLAAIYDGRPDKVLFIDAARSVPYRDVFWVYGAVKSAGVLVTAIVSPETGRTTVR
jgi:biopolymer transport protein ExbD